ncbi:TPA: restriction endonuclease subunit S [Vibrio parahaemolyticus]|uniref:restriction endonuclease subunit S n=1 Tax=Vibrio parahaemolyticus TaxID=670 RepID=UPI00128F1EDE|nr:restriction endonuclease subunit S [Vibrio parahaemolyticus]MDL2041439.1 restriction endonuclease subunit S [Vibrio parahaemolyticus]MQF34514.1 restriction endonuclease subunit S [Vibrio parahaemolyticus]HCG8512238.1 restriction endonuclease subunit S [Vibrio parahaemolyticus]
MVPNGWSAAQFGELADFKSGGTPSKQNASYWGGEEPWISGKDLKSHYLYRSIDQLTTEGFHIAKKAPLGASLILVRGMTLLKDFPVGYATREVAFNQDIKALLAKTNVDGLFLSFLLVGNKHKIKSLVTTAGHGTGRLDTDSLKEFPVDLPPLSEQRKIAQILSTWDKAIATTEKLIDTSKQQKKALMQQLLTGKKRLVNPETGKAFEGDWEEVKLSHFFDRVTEKNKGQSTNVVTISAQHGLIRQEEFFKKSVASDTLDNYFILRKGQFAYNKSYSNGYPMGAIKRLNRYEDAVVTSLYICFELKNEQLASSCFMEQYFESGLLNRGLTKVAAEGGRAHGLLNVKPSDFMALSITAPKFDEQQKIASVLTAADKEIEVLEAKLAHFKQEKKALMQQLLTGKRRVKVEEMEVA